jgi:hypothetical protein
MAASVHKRGFDLVSDSANIAKYQKLVKPQSEKMAARNQKSHIYGQTNEMKHYNSICHMRNNKADLRHLQ